MTSPRTAAWNEEKIWVAHTQFFFTFYTQKDLPYQTFPIFKSCQLHLSGNTCERYRDFLQNSFSEVPQNTKVMP